MARIRSIHPSLPTDEAFMTLTVDNPHAALLWFMLLMQADDNGVFEWKPLTLKARCLPAVDGDIGRHLTALIDLKFIQRFDTGGASYGAIRNFRRYQRPKKPKELYPLPNELRTYVGSTELGSEPSTDETPVEGDEDPPEPVTVPNRFPTGTEKPPQREEGGGRKEGKKDLCPKPAKPVRTRKPYSDDFEAFWRAYPTDQLMSKLEAGKAWDKLSPEDRETAAASIPRFVAYCRSKLDYRPVHAGRYLSQRRFDGFAAPNGHPAPAGDPVDFSHLYDRGL